MSEKSGIKKLRSGNKFNAIVVENGKVARGCPCIADKITELSVQAIDSDGLERVFMPHRFTFKLL